MKPNTHRSITNRAAGGFTLTELLIVIAIIGILAGLGLSGVLSAVKRAKINATRTLVLAINTGIKQFEADFGNVNELKSGDVRKNVRKWLLGLKDDGDPSSAVRDDARWPGDPYVDIRVEDHLGENDHIFIDSWRQPLCFEFDNPIFNLDGWDIWSKGPDMEGSEDMDDFTTGSYEARRKAYKTHKEGGKEVNRDNVGNW